jgi:hypothetical protein
MAHEITVIAAPNSIIELICGIVMISAPSPPGRELR